MHLVDGGYDFGVGQQLAEVVLGVVAHADGAALARSVELLKRTPRLAPRGLVALARPVDEEQIDARHAQLLERQLAGRLGVRVAVAGELGGDKDG